MIEMSFTSKSGTKEQFLFQFVQKFNNDVQRLVEAKTANQALLRVARATVVKTTVIQS